MTESHQYVRALARAVSGTADGVPDEQKPLFWATVFTGLAAAATESIGIAPTINAIQAAVSAAVDATAPRPTET